MPSEQADLVGSHIEADAASYRSAIAHLRCGGEAHIRAAIEKLLPLATSTASTALRAHARSAIRQHFGCVVSDLPDNHAIPWIAAIHEHLAAQAAGVPPPAIPQQEEPWSIVVLPQA